VTRADALITVGLLAACMSACSGKLDAGSDTPHGELPVDERSALVMINDGPHDNWQGEYAILLAARRQVRFVGIVVDASVVYPSLDDNVTGFRELIRAARDSGMTGLPDPTASVAPPLVRPESGLVEDTRPNRSEGARLIVELARRYGTAVHPLAIATGNQLTDAADAYLLDPTLPERAVVVASLGTVTTTGAVAGNPNGNLDAWATTIVATRMRYVQVNGYYDQMLDVPDERVSELPSNALGELMRAKVPKILDLPSACDQVSVMSAALPWFATDVTRMRAEASGDVTQLTPTLDGPIWHVASSDSDRARDQFWAALKDPATFH
jgi:hypothetical protein